MNILEELTGILSGILPVETGVFSDSPPNEYCVLTPMDDSFALYGDDTPLVDVSDVRISVYIKGNYISKVRQITKALLNAEFTVTLRRFVEYERDTGYNHYNIDVQKYCLW